LNWRVQKLFLHSVQQRKPARLQAFPDLTDIKPGRHNVYPKPDRSLHAADAANAVCRCEDETLKDFPQREVLPCYRRQAFQDEEAEEAENQKTPLEAQPSNIPLRSVPA
jgi:hypothetical protein